MCLIIAKRKNVKFNRGRITDYVEQAAKYNRDGLGYAIRKGNENVVEIRRGYSSPTDMFKHIDRDKVKPIDELIIHLRMGTSGLRDITNNHPFALSHDMTKTQKECLLEEQGAFAHNGVLRVFENDTDYCDSYNFMKNFLMNTAATDDLNKDLCYKILYKIKEESTTQKALNDKLSGMQCFVGQKFAFLTKKGLLITGDWLEDNHGNLLSCGVGNVKLKSYS